MGGSLTTNNREGPRALAKSASVCWDFPFSLTRRFDLEDSDF